MLLEVKVPQLSESVSEATLLSWHKQVGEMVKRDENLIDVETDKVVLELPAPADGVLTKILKSEGGSVVAGEVIAQIDTEAKPTSGAPAGVRPEPATVAPTPAPTPETARTDSRLMPAARKLVEEQGVDPTSIAGSGRDGRITKADVLEKIAGAAVSAQPAVAPATAIAAKPSPPPVRPSTGVEEAFPGRSEQRVPMSRLRARIAERLVQAQQEAAILTTFNEVNMQAVMDLRNKYRERFEKEHGVRLGFMSFFVKASVHALRKYPVLNASVDGNDIVYHGYFDIGIAVSSPRGLVVPILRDADQLPLAEIEKQIADFGKRAQDGKLGIEELTGGHVLHLERRSIRLHAFDADHQSATKRDPGHTRDEGPAGGGGWPDRGAPDELSGAVLRPPNHRRAGGRAWACRHQGSARGSRAAAA